jgi:Asp-tRNA(Asn)/Glu-tRNA(Gln) amidotransferase A subunit family amidase
MGMQTVEVSLPHTEYAVATYYILACAEASANLSRYDGVKYGYRSEHADNLMDMYTNTREEGFGEEVKRRILLGTFVLSSGYYDAYYLKGQKARTLIKHPANVPVGHFHHLRQPGGHSGDVDSLRSIERQFTHRPAVDGQTLR